MNPELVNFQLPTTDQFSVAVDNGTPPGGGMGQNRPMVRGVCPLDLGCVARDYGIGSTTA
jgi:hypothetical protein